MATYLFPLELLLAITAVLLSVVSYLCGFMAGRGEGKRQAPPHFTKS